MSTITVKPMHDKCPAHPTHGKLPAEGGSWPADQFTFRRLRDKDIERIADEQPAETPVQETEAESVRKRR